MNAPDRIVGIKAIAKYLHERVGVDWSTRTIIRRCSAPHNPLPARSWNGVVIVERVKLDAWIDSGYTR